MLFYKNKQAGFILHYDQCIDQIKTYDTKIFEQGYIIEEHSTTPAELDYTIGKNLIAYRIDGDSKTVVTPGENPPIKILGVGDLVEEGIHQGEYLITVVIRENFINPEYLQLNKDISNGQIIDSQGRCVSDYIPINHFITYMGSGIFQQALEYDENNILLRQVQFQTINGVRVYTPSNDAKFVRICMFMTNITTARFQPHRENAPYDDFEEPVSIEIYLPRPVYKGEWIEFKDGKGIFHQEYQLSQSREIEINLPNIPTFKDEITPNGVTSIVDLISTVKPIEFYCKYRSARHYNPQPLRTGDMNILYTANNEALYTRR